MKSSVLFAILLVQIFSLTTATKDTTLVASTLNLNKTCQITNESKNSHLPVTLDINNVTAIFTIPLNNEKVELNNTGVNITAQKGSFMVTINTTAMGDTETAEMTVSDNKDLLWKTKTNSKKSLKNVFLRSQNFADTKTNMTACMGLGIAYGNVNMTNITAVDLGCWTWDKNSANGLGFTILPNASAEALTAKFKSEFCSGCLSSVTIAPLFALILAAFITILNQ